MPIQLLPSDVPACCKSNMKQQMYRDKLQGSLKSLLKTDVIFMKVLFRLQFLWQLKSTSHHLTWRGKSDLIYNGFQQRLGWALSALQGISDKTMNEYVCMCVCVWKYVCMYVWIYLCLNVFLYVFMYVYMLECLNVCM